MKAVLDSPFFGVVLSILTYEIGLLIHRKTKIAAFNPLLISMALTVALLMGFHIDVDSYNKGGSLISFFLGPATVILAVPLYRQFHLLKSNLIPILAGIVVGCVTAIISVALFARLFGLDTALIASLIPKSITTPIGIEVSAQLGGIPAVTVASIIITGIAGAILAPYIFKWCRIHDTVAQGIAIGTSSHALGTTKAVEMGDTQGAMSGLAIGLAGLATVLLAPVLVQLLHLL